MSSAPTIARPTSRSWARAWALLGILAGTGLGCVDIEPPWDKAGWPIADAGASAVRPDTADAPGPVTNHDGAIVIIDTQADRWPDTAADAPSPTDTRCDAPGLCGDAGRDTCPEAPKPDGGDAPLRQDQDANLDSLLPDTDVADLPIDATAQATDAGLEALSLQGLVAYYPCENAKGTVLADTSGNGRDATLANGAGAARPTGFTFAAGKVGNGLSFSAKDKAYLSLPIGIVSKLSQVTIATWVKLNSNAAYQRIFDFGFDINTFMYLSNAGSSGNVRFRISSASLQKSQAIEGTTGLPVGTWVHTAVTLGDDGVSLFVDGVSVAQQTPALLRPSDLGGTTNNNIARSQFYEDPYLDGQIDDFRIYDRVLSPTEIAALASGR